MVIRAVFVTSATDGAQTVHASLVVGALGVGSAGQDASAIHAFFARGAIDGISAHSWF